MRVPARTARGGRRPAPVDRSTSVLAVLATAGAGAAAGWALRAAAPGGPATWERRNYAGRRVSLVEGPAWSVGAVLAVLAAPGLRGPARAGAALATTGAAVFGLVDDLAGSPDKGLRGHVTALAAGRLTTGGLKVLGIGAASLAAAWPLLAVERGARPAGPDGRRRAARDAVVAGALVAGSANLANLLDLRPGRVLKLVVAAAPVTWVCAGAQRPQGGPAVRTALLMHAAAAGASAALLPADLGERAMLGDCGANAAGALLGAALVTGTSVSRRPSTVRAASLAVVVALTLASERVSFTRVIERTPVLRELDAVGRRPAAAAQDEAGVPP